MTPELTVHPRACNEAMADCELPVAPPRIVATVACWDVHVEVDNTTVGPRTGVVGHPDAGHAGVTAAEGDVGDSTKFVLADPPLPVHVMVYV
ncbi:MAG TPA: hypothetical protein VMA75_04250 [Candidatus Paceibacterota bacterium]|nr:hypothetical protein [Candidatus Paceibacterota bacterium]